MQLQELPWGLARRTDRTFTTYVAAYADHPSSTPAPINQLPKESRSIIKHMLDPDPTTRWSIEDCLKDKWISTIASPAAALAAETKAAAAAKSKPSTPVLPAV